jgi:DDE family transposase
LSCTVGCAAETAAQGEGVTEFLQEALALWGERGPLGVVRADAGFFDKDLFTFLEERRIPYIVVAHFTKSVKREVTRTVHWRALDENYAVGECEIKLMGWDKARRFVAVREQIRDSRPSVGKKLIDLPEYAFRVLVTSLAAPPEEIWRDYNHRADMENRIAELKHDLGADRFCLQDFHAANAVFRSVLLLFNLLSEFRRASGIAQHKEPGTLRSQVFLCGGTDACRERNYPVDVHCMGWTQAAHLSSYQHPGLGFSQSHRS